MVAAVAIAATSFTEQSGELAAGCGRPDDGHDGACSRPTSRTSRRSPSIRRRAHLIAGSNDEQRAAAVRPGPVRGADAAGSDCSFFPGVGTDGVYTSSDGGPTWTNRGLLDDQALRHGGSLVSDGDPVIVYGPKPAPAAASRSPTAPAPTTRASRSYQPAQRRATRPPSTSRLARSDDNGVDLAAPGRRSQRRTATRSTTRTRIWADSNPSSPYFGRVYVSWTQFRGDPRAAPSRSCSSYSTDGGPTWSKPKQLRRRTTAATVAGRAPRSGPRPDGKVYVAWEDSDKTGSNQASPISANGGTSFSKPATIATGDRHRRPDPGRELPHRQLPELGADPRRAAPCTPPGPTLRPAAGADRRLHAAGRGRLRGRTCTRRAAPRATRSSRASTSRRTVASISATRRDGDDPTTFGTGNATIDVLLRQLEDRRHELVGAGEGQRRLVGSRRVRAEQPRSASSGATTTRSSRRTRRRGSSTPTPGTVSAVPRSMPTRRAPGRSRRPRTPARASSGTRTSSSRRSLRSAHLEAATWSRPGRGRCLR